MFAVSIENSQVGAILPPLGSRCLALCLRMHTNGGGNGGWRPEVAISMPLRFGSNTSLLLHSLLSSDLNVAVLAFTTQ